MATFQTASVKNSYLKTETSLRPNYGTNREYTVVGTPTKLLELPLSSHVSLVKQAMYSTTCGSRDITTRCGYTRVDGIAK